GYRRRGRHHGADLRSASRICSHHLDDQSLVEPGREPREAIDAHPRRRRRLPNRHDRRAVERRDAQRRVSAERRRALIRRTEIPVRTRVERTKGREIVMDFVRSIPVLSNLFLVERNGMTFLEALPILQNGILPGLLVALVCVFLGAYGIRDL